MYKHNCTCALCKRPDSRDEGGDCHKNKPKPCVECEDIGEQYPHLRESDVYQHIFAGPAELRMSPDSSVPPFQVSATGLLVRRADLVLYPDSTPGKGFSFFLVEFSTLPQLFGFMIAHQTAPHGGGPTTVYLAKTEQAFDAQCTLLGYTRALQRHPRDGDAVLSRDLYQITVDTILRLRSTPDSTTPTNIVQKLPPNLVVRRTDRVYYPDKNPGSGALFIRVTVSTKPPLSGYAALQLSREGRQLETYLAKTVETCRLEKALAI